MDIFSLNTSLLLNIMKTWNNNKEKNMIIDPISCLIKLSILGFHPIGTKISIINNMVNIVEPSIFQGAWRFINGDGREDLHNLYAPIIKSIEWYYKENTEITHLFDFAGNGLEVLKKAYPSNSTICHTLDLYIQHIRTRKKTTYMNQNIEYNGDDTNRIHDFLKKLWEPDEIHIVINLLLVYNKKKELNETQIFTSIMELTCAKEKKLTQFLKEHLGSL